MNAIIPSMANNVETFYLHLEFLSKNCWSINLPFLCTSCGNCCTIEDFLSAGKIDAKIGDFPEIHARLKDFYKELGKIWEQNESKYDEYISQNKCLFLKNNSCSIYIIRPEGCRVFPKTAFGMESKDCEPLIRFKRMHKALKKGRKSKATYYFTGKNEGLTEQNKPTQTVKITEKQCQSCTVRLRKAGMTDKELGLLNFFNDRV
jgi:Fe-S-cluster containining protein